jgi:hypothetical protein
MIERPPVVFPFDHVNPITVSAVTAALFVNDSGGEGTRTSVAPLPADENIPWPY